MKEKMADLLLLHGALANESQFDSLISTLEISFKPILFTFPGHRLEDTEESTFAIEELANSLAAFLDARQQKQIHVFGYSLGGYVALYLAEKRPDLFDRIFTLGTNFFWTKEFATKNTILLDSEKIAEKIPKFAAALQGYFGATYWKIVVAKTVELLSSLGENDLLTEDTLKNIRNQAVVAVSEDDEMVDKTKSQQAVKALPNGRYLVIPKSKHAIEKTDPNLLHSYLNNFFEVENR